MAYGYILNIGVGTIAALRGVNRHTASRCSVLLTERFKEQTRGTARGIEVSVSGLKSQD